MRFYYILFPADGLTVQCM